MNFSTVRIQHLGIVKRISHEQLIILQPKSVEALYLESIPKNIL